MRSDCVHFVIILTGHAIEITVYNGIALRMLETKPFSDRAVTDLLNDLLVHIS